MRCLWVTTEKWCCQHWITTDRTCHTLATIIIWLGFSCLFHAWRHHLRCNWLLGGGYSVNIWAPCDSRKDKDFAKEVQRLHQGIGFFQKFVFRVAYEHWKQSVLTLTAYKFKKLLIQCAWLIATNWCQIFLALLFFTAPTFLALFDASNMHLIIAKF